MDDLYALAGRCLADSARKSNVARGRCGAQPGKALRIVGRETAQLQPEQINRAVVETVAENTVDGIIAPLFFLLLGGAPLAMAYKAVNTLDSMVGYKHENTAPLVWSAPALMMWRTVFPRV